MVERMLIYFNVGRMWASQSQSQPQLSQQQQQQQQQQQPASTLRTLGMTSAISLAGPKALDHQRTAELQEVLKPYNVFETDEELNHRYVQYFFYTF